MSTFGIPKTTATATSLSTNPASTSAPTLGSFGFSTPGSSTTGITFGAPSTLASTFSTTTTQASQTGFTFPTSTAATGFNLLGTSFGAKTTTTTSSFNLFSTPATATSLPSTSTTTTGFNVGIPATSAPTGFNIGAPAATSASTFNLGVAATTSATGFSMKGLTFTTTATATTSTGFNWGNKGLLNSFQTPKTTTTTAATGFTLDKAANPTFSSSATTTISSLTAPATTTSATSTLLNVSSAATLENAAAQVKFSQLEENINKWTIELEEQEKVFMNQVAHINEWDRLLLSNGDKIISLNNNVEKLKLEQQQLDHELDFIVAQQRELEECLLPLEKEFADITVSDPERDATYLLAENLNTQLRHMSEDLKEIIEDINEKNKNQDPTDPIVQIGRILNAHMNSLQWIDQNTTLIKQQLDQVTKLTEIHRRENDSTQNL